MSEFLEATYIGKDTLMPAVSAHPNGKYYRAKMKLNDREVTAFLVEDDRSRRRGLRVIGWYDLDDPKHGETFRERGCDKFYTESKGDFEHAEPEIPSTIDLSQLEVPMPYEYVPDGNKSEFHKVQVQGRVELNNQLFDMKKRAILEARKDQFKQRIKQDEIEMPEISLNSILPRLSEDEKEEAKKIFDRTLRCVLYGKYSYKDYVTVMKHLVDIVKNKGIVISNSSADRTIYEHPAHIDGKETGTFKIPGDSFVAKKAPSRADRYWAEKKNDYTSFRRILDIDYGTDGIRFYSMDSLKEEEEGKYYVWCDGKTRPTQKKPLGVIFRDYDDSYLVFTTGSGELTFIHSYYKDNCKVKEPKTEQDR